MLENLRSDIGADDLERINAVRNPPEFEAGFENESMEDDYGFASLFDDEGMDIPAPMGYMTEEMSFGGQSPEVKKDWYDKLCDTSAAGVESTGRVLIGMIKDVKLRTADDWGYYFVQIMKTAAAVIGISVILILFGMAGGFDILKPFKLPLQLIVTGGFMLGSGCLGLGAAAYCIEKFENGDHMESITETEIDTDAGWQEYETMVSSMEDVIFEDSAGFEELLGAYTPDEDEGWDEIGYTGEDTFYEEMRYDEKVAEITSDVKAVNREMLFNMFKPFFPLNTPGFAEENVIETGSDRFRILEVNCLNALASAAKMELEDVAAASGLESASETYFTYEFYLKRIKGLNRVEDIEREMLAYFRESGDDIRVTCKVTLERHMYRVTLNKGVSAIITLGDIFQMAEVARFFKNPQNILPVIAGITENGKPMAVDAKNFDTMMIAGKPRSGKSWYMLSLIWVMMVFNTPEDVQFLIIDPKSSNLFRTLALMPHVCGIHDDRNILSILEDVIDKEAKRRKKILADNRCENIWDLRKKGIRMPVLYVVIDEVMTVMANLGAASKEFTGQLKVIVSQLPSQGIRLIFVPHRAQGVVDKTIRTNIAFTAAVRADPEVIRETLDVKKWTTPLLNPGDTALKMQGEGKELFVHSPAITASDPENTDHIMNVARAFYKMGVDIPDMSGVGIGCNRDMTRIREELGLEEDNGFRVQFDV